MRMVRKIKKIGSLKKLEEGHQVNYQKFKLNQFQFKKDSSRMKSE